MLSVFIQLSIMFYNKNIFLATPTFKIFRYSKFKEVYRLIPEEPDLLSLTFYLLYLFITYLSIHQYILIFDALLFKCLLKCYLNAVSEARSDDILNMCNRHDKHMRLLAGNHDCCYRTKISHCSFPF